MREVPSLRGKLLQWNPSLSEENWVREVKNALKMDVQFDDADRSGGSDRLTVEVISEFGLRSLSRGRAVQRPQYPADSSGRPGCWRGGGRYRR